VRREGRRREGKGREEKSAPMYDTDDDELTAI